MLAFSSKHKSYYLAMIFRPTWWIDKWKLDVGSDVSEFEQTVLSENKAIK